jgi:integrase
MASVSYVNGVAIIQFACPRTGKRRTIRLGKRSAEAVALFRRRLESLIIAAKFGDPPSTEVTTWLRRMTDAEYAKLVAVQLAAPRAMAVLGPFLTGYIAERTDVEPSTVQNLKMAAARLIKFFGADRRMRDITPADADRFLINLKSADYAEATRARTIRYACQFFTAAIRGQLLTENPFAGVHGGSESNSARSFFVTREATAVLLDACPDREWRLIVALSRFAGVRCPSETLTLEWTDFNWARSRFAVRAPKTGTRIVPIFPELLPQLRECFEAASDGKGATHVITRYRDTSTNLRTQLHRILARAGLPRWERAFHNLRASRQTELAASYPLHVVCAWLGNSAKVAMKHYLQVREEDFERATAAAVLGSRAAKSAALTGFMGCIDDPETPTDSRELQDYAFSNAGDCSDQDSNPEHRGRSSG